MRTSFDYCGFTPGEKGNTGVPGEQGRTGEPGKPGGRGDMGYPGKYSALHFYMWVENKYRKEEKKTFKRKEKGSAGCNFLCYIPVCWLHHMTSE